MAQGLPPPRRAATPRANVIDEEPRSGETTPLLVGELAEEYIVTWEEHDDSEHPYSWPRWRTMSNCILISAMTFLTALASGEMSPENHRLTSTAR